MTMNKAYMQFCRYHLEKRGEKAGIACMYIIFNFHRIFLPESFTECMTSDNPYSFHWKFFYRTLIAVL